MNRAFTILLLLMLAGSLGFAQTPSSGLSDEVSGVVQGESAPLFIPNAFTPNDDGVNDEFYIPNSRLTNFEFAVFDRWGNEVYRTYNPSFRWNGERNGSDLPSGTYVFLLTATDQNGKQVKRTGPINMVR